MAIKINNLYSDYTMIGIKSENEVISYDDEALLKEFKKIIIKPFDIKIDQILKELNFIIRLNEIPHLLVVDDNSIII